MNLDASTMEAKMCFLCCGSWTNLHKNQYPAVPRQYKYFSALPNELGHHHQGGQGVLPLSWFFDQFT